MMSGKSSGNLSTSSSSESEASPAVSDVEESNEGVLFEKVWTSAEALDVRNRSMVGDFYRFEVDLTNSQGFDTPNGRLGYRICFIPDSGSHRVYSSVKTIRVR